MTDVIIADSHSPLTDAELMKALLKAKRKGRLIVQQEDYQRFRVVVQRLRTNPRYGGLEFLAQRGNWIKRRGAPFTFLIEPF